MPRVTWNVIFNIKIQWFRKIVCEIEKKEQENYNVTAVASTSVDSDFMLLVPNISRTQNTPWNTLGKNVKNGLKNGFSINSAI